MKYYMDRGEPKKKVGGSKFVMTVQRGTMGIPYILRIYGVGEHIIILGYLARGTKRGDVRISYCDTGVPKIL